MKVFEIAEGFSLVRNAAPRKMDTFFNYIDKVYISGKLRQDGKRGKPRFPPEFWSMQQNTMDGIPRTTNPQLIQTSTTWLLHSEMRKRI